MIGIAGAGPPLSGSEAHTAAQQCPGWQTTAGRQGSPLWTDCQLPEASFFLHCRTLPTPPQPSALGSGSELALGTFWVTNRRTNLSSWGTEDSGTSSEVSGSESALLLPRGHLAPGYRLQQCRCGKWGLSQSISWAWACTAHLLEGVLSCAHHPFLHEAVFQYSGQSWMTRGLCVWSSFHL